MTVARPVSSPTASLVDWDAATQIAARLAPPGPLATREILADLVDGLRAAAGAAVPHVLDVTGLTPARGSAALGEVYVVDRARWAWVNTQIMATLTDGVAEELARRGGDEPPGPSIPPIAALAGAAEVGTVLAALSSRVLGQFDPYSGVTSLTPAAGRLVLVAPNVLQVERALTLDADDFRLWVCLHEQTHAIQFAAAPWLADHLRRAIKGLLLDLADSSRRLAKAPLGEKFSTVGRAVAAAVRGEGTTLAQGLLTPDQQRTVEEVSAVMALLEGHADVAMDAVGPRVVPTVRAIRRAFEARRDGAGRGRFDVILRRLLGMDAKIAQYRDGAAFVRAVEAQVGRVGLNAVWAAPENLPTAREIADARAWVRRVHG